MNTVSRGSVTVAALALGGVCVLGLFLGVRGSLDRPYGGSIDSGSATPAQTAMRAGMASAVEARPYQGEVAPTPVAVADAKPAAPKPRPKPVDDDVDNTDSDEPPPPELVGPPGPPPPAAAPAPPAKDDNLPPY